MKITLIVLLFVASSVSAQTLECPARSGNLELRDATTFFDDKISEVQGDYIAAKNGYALALPLNVRYLACNYHDDVTVWKEFAPRPDAKICKMTVRENRGTKKSIKLHCK